MCDHDIEGVQELKLAIELEEDVYTYILWPFLCLLGDLECDLDDLELDLEDDLDLDGL